MPRKSLGVMTESMFYTIMAFQAGRQCGTEESPIHSLPIRNSAKRQLNNLFVTIFWSIFYPLLYFFRGFSLFLTIAEIGLPIIALSVTISLWIVIDEILGIIHLQRLKTKLKAGFPLDCAFFALME